MQSMLFQYDSDEDVRAFLRSFSGIATVKEGPDLCYYTQLPGQPPFQFDCEFVASGFVTTRDGDYSLFLGRFIDALTSRFGEIVLGPENAFPGIPNPALKFAPSGRWDAPSARPLAPR